MNYHPLVSSLLLGLAVGCGSSTPEPAANPEPAKAESATPAKTAEVAKPVASDDAPQKTDIVDTAVGAGSFKTLAAALKAADLIDTLKGPGPFTVFAPTDDAFAKLPKGTLDDLLKPENKAKLQKILTYHVVSGRVGSDKVATMSTAKTVQGSDVKIATKSGSVMINNAKVVKADIACSNGVIHVVDSVLLPQ